MNEENTHINTEQPFSSMQKSFRAVHAATGFVGNVRATISDRRFRDADNNTYYPELLSTNTYYPFGMGISSLSVQGGYRFGFQGQEKDDEISGSTGTHYAFTYRMYDARIGRFFSVDPLTSKYPHYTPYSFSGNKVIHAIELEGLEEWLINQPDGNSGTINGPYANQEAAQSAFNSTLVGNDGFVIGYGVLNKQMTNLEKGSMNTINGVVLHRTASSSAESALTSFKSGIGTHFLIDKEGSIFQTADLNKYTYHVGKIKSKCYEAGNCSDAETKKIKGYGWSPKKVYENEKTKSYPDRYPYYIDAVGIEVVGAYDSKTKTWEKLTDKQVEAVGTLVNLLKMHYDMKFSDIYTHEGISYKTAGEGQVVLDAVKEKIKD